MLTLAMLLGLLVGGLLVSAGILWLSARLVRAGKPTFARALACVVVLGVVGVAFQALAANIPRTDLVPSLLIAGVELLIGLLLIWIILARMFQITFARSMLLSLPYLALAAVFAGGLIHLLPRFLLGAYIMPTNSMAPTLIGWHHRATCPHCQGVAIVPGSRPDDDMAAFARWERRSMPGICSKCRKLSEFEHWPTEVHRPMRFLCNLLMEPRRGDVTVFRYPPEPNVLYAQRLVGLPGDQVEIKNGALWINGSKWTPPADVEGLTYHPWPGFPMLDDEREPRSWELGPDQFFMLGDFTTSSNDSREWGPVPRENLVGVATLIYWPPSAWRVLR